QQTAENKRGDFSFQQEFHRAFFSRRVHGSIAPSLNQPACLMLQHRGLKRRSPGIKNPMQVPLMSPLRVPCRPIIGAATNVRVAAARTWAFVTGASLLAD